MLVVVMMVHQLLPLITPPHLQTILQIIHPPHRGMVPMGRLSSLKVTILISGPGTYGGLAMSGSEAIFIRELTQIIPIQYK